MSGPTIYHLFFALTLLIFTTLFLRLLTILPSINPRPPPKSQIPSHTHLMIILGSGGHTAEMLSMLRSLPLEKYRFRTYVVSSEDEFSAWKAVEFERERRRSSLLLGNGAVEHTSAGVKEGGGHETETWDEEENAEMGNYCIRRIPRARRIHQSLWSTPFTSLLTLLTSLRILTTYPSPSPSAPSSISPPPSLFTPAPFTTLPHPHPTIILTNGPGTSLILVLAALLLKYLNHQSCWSRGCMRTVYVETWARCKTLSLTGRLLGAWGVVDRFLVQWEGLVAGRREFRGVLVA